MAALAAGDWGFQMKRCWLATAAAIAISISLAWIGAARAATPLDDVEHGMQLFLQGQYADADQAFADALSQNPVDPLARLWKGLAEAALQRPFAGSYFLETTDQVLGGASTDLLVMYDWRQGEMADVKQILQDCIHMGDVRWRAGCEDLKRGVDSGASAPAVKDWPADSGLLKITKARATVWKPTQ